MKAPDIMIIGPTNLERQRMAFKLLRDQARSAHLQGDGLRVANLVETAAQQLRHLIDNQKFLLKVSEIQWIVIFRLYWLLSNYSCWETKTLLEKLVPQDAKDAEVLEYLKVYQYLIAEPLDSGQDIINKISAIKVTSFGENGEVETRELVRHFVELSWFRNPHAENWKAIIAVWNKEGLTWASEALAGMEKRLHVQTRLTSPSRRFPPYTEMDLAEIKAVSPLAELWALHVLGNSKRLHQALTDFDLSAASRFAEWRTITDYWHTNEGRYSLVRNNNTIAEEITTVDQRDTYGFVESRRARSLNLTGATPPISQDSMDVWLARRRFMSADSPFFRFCDYREGRVDECCYELFRKQEVGAATLRFEIWQLAMLHEIASLRLWDFGIWRTATKAEGEVLLEASRWNTQGFDILSHGFSLLIHSLSMRDPDKDRLIKGAIDLLELSPEKSLRQIFDACLYCYPRAYYGASELLESIADFAPTDLLERLSVWTVSFANSRKNRESLGWKRNCLKFWKEIIPIVPLSSQVWTILSEDISRLAEFTYGWRGGDEAKIIKAWLIWAPVIEAEKLAGKLISIEALDNGNRIGRAELASEVERLRPELKPSLSDKLLLLTTSHLEKKILLGAIAGDSLQADIELKSRVSSSIRDAMLRAAPSDPSAGFMFGPFPSGISEIPEWNSEDIGLVRDLIDTVNSAHVHREWLWWLINTLQLIVANGTQDLAIIVEPEILKWSKKMPTGKSFIQADTGAWSVVQKSEDSDGQLMDGIGWLAFQLVRKSTEGGYYSFLSWAEAAIRMDKIDALSIALYGAATVAAKSDEVTQVRALLVYNISFRKLLSAMDTDVGASTFGGGLRYLSSILLKGQTDIYDWLTMPGSRAFQEIHDLLEETALRITRSRKGAVRKGLGMLLWNLKQWSELSPNLLQAWNQLCIDGRASVRIATLGGWEAELRRRSSKAT